MTEFRISNMPNSSVINTYHERLNIQLAPTYQREGDVWPLEKRQLLINSLLNGFDIPKFYLHEFYPAQKIAGRLYRYAIIDGRQRLESIWRFIDDEFPLEDKFEYLRDKGTSLGGLKYSEIGAKFPQIRDYFNGLTLSIVTIMTESEDLIDEMFYRLNEAAPLNAAEKRNAFGGPLPACIRKIAKNKFFTSCLPFTNKRYRHYDLACKLLYLTSLKGASDTKKIHLDKFVRKTRDKSDAAEWYNDVSRICGRLYKIFSGRDDLLSSPGLIVVYYLLVMDNWNPPASKKISRLSLKGFETKRIQNKALAETDELSADFELLEFDRLQQTPNDRYSIEFKLTMLKKHLGITE